jgi:hypothetical protein
MVRIGQCAPAIVAAILFLSGHAAGGQEPRAVQLEGLRLGDALADLQRRGLKIIYSSEVVRPAMRVRTVPHVMSLRRLLDELVAEHGLITQDGPGGTVLVVKNPRARLDKTSAPLGKQARSPAASAPAAGDGVFDHRYEETVDVTDAAPSGAGRGPAPLVVATEGPRALAGGFENLFRAAQALPGVTSTDELGSRISVRGGSPDENLTVMDGIEIYYPFRLVVRSEDRAMVGLASTFNAETVQSAELSAGAFDVQYGDRLSSLLVVKHREGSDAERLEGAASLSVADANLVIEGRLPRQATGSWLVSARRSYLGLVAERVVGGALPSFQDVHARASWYPRPRQRASLVALAGGEHTRPGRFASADAATTTRTRNALVALTFESSVGSVGWSRTIVSRSQFSDALGGSEQSFDNSRGANTVDSIATGGLLAFQFLRDAAVRDVAVRQELAFTPSSRHQLDLGGEAHALDTRWAWRISGDRSQHEANGSSVQLGTGLPDFLDSSRNVRRVAGWVEDRWQIAPRLTLQPGLRVDRSSLTGQSTLSPRVSLGLMAGRGWRLDAAFRRHSQTPGSEPVEFLASEGRAGHSHRRQPSGRVSRWSECPRRRLPQTLSGPARGQEGDRRRARRACARV